MRLFHTQSVNIWIVLFRILVVPKSIYRNWLKAMSMNLFLDQTVNKCFCLQRFCFKMDVWGFWTWIAPAWIVQKLVQGHEQKSFADQTLHICVFKIFLFHFSMCEGPKMDLPKLDWGHAYKSLFRANCVHYFCSYICLIGLILLPNWIVPIFPKFVQGH